MMQHNDIFWIFFYFIGAANCLSWSSQQEMAPKPLRICWKRCRNVIYLFAPTFYVANSIIKAFLLL